jgi:hypothetical protein
MSDTATVPVSLLIEAAECAQSVADGLAEGCAYNGKRDDIEDQAEYERLSALAERLRAAADQGAHRSDIWPG